MAVEVTEDRGVVRVTFSGAITGDDLAALIRDVIGVEAKRRVSPHRLVDLGASSTMAVSFANVASLASARREISPHNPIRTAILVHNATQHGFARMFQTVNDHPLVTVRIFESRDEAERWLEAPEPSKSDA